MWAETRGEWPAEAAVLYPFTGSEYAVRIDEETCRTVAADSVAVVKRLEDRVTADASAVPSVAG